MNEEHFITSEFPDRLIPAGSGYILWLASWYPSKTVPYNGDFIQRHAYAVSLYRQILLVHMIHDPAASSELYYDVTVRNNLTEVIIYFRHADPSAGFINKLHYNLTFFSQTKIFIRELFNKYSLPLFVHVHVPMKMGKIAAWINKKWGLSYLLSEHSASYLKQAPDSYFSRSTYYRQNVKRIFRHALAVTNVSGTVGEILRQTFSIDKFYIVRNTVDNELFFFKNRSADKFRFIHVSTMTFQKNVEGLIRAFEQFSVGRENVELLLAGPISAEGKRRVEVSPAASQIIVTGEVPYKDIAILMQESDCFVLFSRYENFPCVIIEALCCGLPVITSDAGGAGEAVDAGNGIVVPSEDEAALVESMTKMTEGYHQYSRKEIAEKAAKLYSYPAIGKDFLELYKQLRLVN